MFMGDGVHGLYGSVVGVTINTVYWSVFHGICKKILPQTECGSAGWWTNLYAGMC